MPQKDEVDPIEASEDPEQIEENNDSDSDSNPEDTNQEIDELQLEAQNNEAQNLWPEEDLLTQEKEDSVDPLELTTNLLSYERFFPGRILGNTFVARSNSGRPLKFTLKFENNGIDRLFVGEKL